MTIPVANSAAAMTRLNPSSEICCASRAPSNAATAWVGAVHASTARSMLPIWAGSRTATMVAGTLTTTPTAAATSTFVYRHSREAHNAVHPGAGGEQSDTDAGNIAELRAATAARRPIRTIRTIRGGRTFRRRSKCAERADGDTCRRRAQ
jgi:hypothetical protein